MRDFHKWVDVGTGECGRVFVEIEWVNNKGGKSRLSLTGVEGPKRNGDATGGCGQIADSLPLAAEGPVDVGRLAEVWKAWHLNDMRAACEHQRAGGWDKRPIDPSKPTSAYGKHFEGQRQDSWNMLGWVTRSEHPEGLLSFPCPVCHYEYGSAWLHEDVPEDVLEFLDSLPADSSCPWRLSD